MPIAQTKYINIKSTAGAVPAVSQRELIGRVFTSNYLVPANTVIEFDGGAEVALSDIAKYFGENSSEYSFANKYFSFESKKGLKAKKIGFGRYLSEDIPASVIGDKNISLSTLRAITLGELKLVVNGVEVLVGNINLSSAESLVGVASIVSDVVNESNDVVCEYDATNGRFVLETVATGDGQTLDVLASDLATALGFTVNKIVSDSATQKSALQSVSSLAEISNNFFSFTFLDSLGQEDVVELGQWTHNQNVRYMFSHVVNPTNAETIQEALKDFDGVALTLDIYNEYASFMPMAAIAAIDYTKRNSAIDMMYQQFVGVKPSVSENSTASQYDAIRVNYYGATQQAGNIVSFYQDGLLQGSIRSMGVYANEAWLKDAFFTRLLDLRLGLDTLPASTTGKSLVMNVMSEVIEQALLNGVILAGKTLDSVKKAYITQVTGDTDAWMAVQSAGYWMDVKIVEYIENEVSKYKISYTLVYSKGDSINFIDGSDILI